MSSNGETKRWVTLAELDEKLDKVPTRWEVRFLILAAFAGGQVAPSIQWQHPAKSAVSIVRALV